MISFIGDIKSRPVRFFNFSCFVSSFFLSLGRLKASLNGLTKAWPSLFEKEISQRRIEAA